MVVMQDITTPTVDVLAILPIVVTLGAAVLAVLVDAFAPAPRRMLVNASISALALATALVWSITRISAIGATAVCAENDLATPISTAFAIGMRSEIEKRTSAPARKRSSRDRSSWALRWARSMVAAKPPIALLS